MTAPNDFTEDLGHEADWIDAVIVAIVVGFALGYFVAKVGV